MKRDLYIDAIRGAILLLMMLVHLPGYLGGRVYEALGYVSEAEGFVFISGLVAGLAYLRRADQGGIRDARARVWRRAATVYAFHLVSFLVVAWLLRPIVKATPFLASTWTFAADRPWLEVVAASVTLQYQPQGLDILPMYVEFLIFFPLMISQLRAGRGGWLLGLSLALWVAAEAGLRELLHSRFDSIPADSQGYFDPFAWQFLFVLGLLSAHCHRQGRWPVDLDSKKLVGGCVFIVAAGLIVRHACPFLLQQSAPAWARLLFGKPNLGIVRLVDFAGVVVLVRFCWRRLAVDLPANPLSFLGQHSLPVFAAHVPLMYLGTHLLLRSGKSWPLYAGVVTVCFAVLFATAWAHAKWQVAWQRAFPRPALGDTR